ncbi:hypothetical protein [Kineococcus rhizosphaerae]|uniref:Signal transduction histidine kinase n=1 Tax=Kineococcus rhizosphaerae TaxID=559628 RepID=A0A2T0R4C8_9ACTN|nr:hypothetical protein [Kineococcus rhizosphaerae]PRY15226.1 hypothetical protein CLV37_105152 [Kineococcus rhizosphaerae]
MSGVQRACLLGVVIWLSSHGPLVALLSLHEHRAPWLSLTALAVVLVASAWAVRPLLGGPLELRLPAALLLAAVVPVSGLAVTPFLDDSLWRTYANYWPGLTQIVVSALVMRRRWLPALAAEIASAAVLGACLLASDLPHRGIAFAALNQPAIVWFSASLGVRLLFDRTARDVARFEADAGRAVAARAGAEARERSAAQRREDLEHSAAPLLRRVAVTGPDSPAWPLLSRAALTLERRLRDDLRARELLDDDVRAGLRAARDRGCEVDVVDDRGPGAAHDREFVAQLRAVLAPLLNACGTARVTFRLPPGGGWATVSVDGSAREADAVAAALRLAHLRGVDLRVETDLQTEGGAGSLWAELRP